jgi:hypothetical protein
MTTPKSLPARPSQESLRKQAKKLSRDIATGNAAGIARARAQLPNAELPLSTRDAQLVLAREYGFPGWQQLIAEVQKRLSQGFEWAVSQAHRMIHDNDVGGLKQLLAEYPALLSWRDNGGLLGIATSSFGDSGDANLEEKFTRAACAELLLDAGAVLSPSVCDGLVESRAKGLLQMFERRGLLPRTLNFRIALGDGDAIRALVETGDNDLIAMKEAFRCACRFEDETAASFLLDRLIARDAELGRQIDGGPGRLPFIRYLIEQRWLNLIGVTPDGPWQAFVMQRVVGAIHDRDLAAFIRGLQRDSWLLGDSCVDFQVGLIDRAALHGQARFIDALLGLDPALLRRRPPPHSQAIEFAIVYAKTNLLPLLTRVWPLPDDLAHAAGVGNLEQVKKWFDASGKPALGDLMNHFPCNSAYTRGNLQWGEPSEQQALDTALAWSVLNRHFDVADFLLAHGADINTRWSSHEPASILHELTVQNNYEGMQFLIDRGIDMTIEDYRWGGTAQGWAYHAARNEKMAQWLGEAERKRGKDKSADESPPE